MGFTPQRQSCCNVIENAWKAYALVPLTSKYHVWAAGSLCVDGVSK